MRQVLTHGYLNPPRCPSESASYCNLGFSCCSHAWLSITHSHRGLALTMREMRCCTKVHCGQMKEQIHATGKRDQASYTIFNVPNQL